MSNEPSISELNALQYLRTIEHKGHQLSKKYVDEGDNKEVLSTSNQQRPHSEYTSRASGGTKKGILSNLKIETPDLREFDSVSYVSLLYG